MIKLFEEYDNEFYAQISRDEYDDMYNDVVDFDKSDIKTLLNLYPKYLSVDIDSFSLILRVNTNRKNKYLFGSIYRLPDEWYVVQVRINYHKVYYKCDQQQGVIKLLEDLL